MSETIPGGLFISFEGIDGAGKSTHIAALAEAFRAQGRSVTVTREPGGTELAEALRGLLLQQPMDVLTEALLVFAARRDHLLRVIEPALQGGAVVLCDRFTDSSFAYQGAQGLDLEVLRDLERWVQRTPGVAEGALRQPELTLLFELPSEDAATRRAAARVPDKFEQRGADFFDRVAQGFSERADGEPRRFARIRAGEARDVVWAQVRAAVARRGWLEQGA